MCDRLPTTRRLLVLLAAMSLSLSTAAEAASSVTLVSSKRTSASQDFRAGGVSADGTLVLYADGTQIYMFSTRTRKHELVSATATGRPGNDVSMDPRMSDDGRFVVFASKASNLVAGDRNQVTDFFLRDRQTRRTVRVNVDPATGRDVRVVDANGFYHSALHPAVSGDGSTVVFPAYGDMSGGTVSYSSSYDPAQTVVWALEVATRRVEPVSVDSTGRVANAFGADVVTDRGGRFVAFVATAPLVPADQPTDADIYLRDRVRRTTRLVPTTADSSPTGLVMDRAATKIVYNGDGSMRVADLRGGTDSAVDGYNGPSVFFTNTTAATLSGNGRYVFYQGGGAALARADLDSQKGDIHWFRRDLQSNATEVAFRHASSSSTWSTGPGGCVPLSAAYLPVASYDGRSFAFSANQRVTGDDPDCYADVYLVKL